MKTPDRLSRAAALLAVCGFALTAGTAFAQASGGSSGESGAEGQTLTVSEPWMRYIIAERPAAGYLVVRNAGERPAALTGASSPACGMMHLHESVDGAMRAVDSLSVPAGGEAELAPGGYHLMCMKPDMEPGQSVPVTLSFSDGSALVTAFQVYGATGKPE